MLASIISHTPIWVWFVLYYLIRTGFRAMSDQAIKPQRLIILPLLFLFLSIQSIRAEPTLILLWICGAALGFVVGNLLFSAHIKGAYSGEDHRVYLRGTPNLLILMVASFVTHYALDVLIAIHPQLLWTVLNVFMSGLISGAFGYRAIQALRQFQRLSAHAGCAVNRDE
ncbi:MAG: hypothetical protein CENE_01301 [Candidatus Celerinatantimonas neptuna]|nr:MAG: hypothetical protein CENE_01301 [Candidatus Celerinatantimonas neptuna]